MALSSEKAKNSAFNRPNIQHCRYCGKECKNLNSLKQHEVRCKLNPERISVIVERFNNNGRRAWNKGLSKKTDERVLKHSVTFQENHKKGLHKNYGHPTTEDTKKKLRQYALKNNLGGFNMRRGIYYDEVKLDSSYEVIVAKDLDKNKIRWQRCSRFPYHIDNTLHYYTPDFYLPDYDIYLDPKNDFLINNINPNLGYTDIEKIKQVEIENNIKIIILDKNNLLWENIKTLLL